MLVPAASAPRTIDRPVAPTGLDRPLAVELRGVVHRYGEVEALRGIDLSIPLGTTVAILGRNGAGKSTAIGILLGLLRPASGRARTLGLEPREAIAGGRVGAMLQSVGLPAGVRVIDLLEFVRGLYPNPMPTARLLERAGLATLRARPVEALSGGETQRLRFALAIAGDPDLVFLDEPTVGMDVDSRRAFWEEIRRSAGDGRTILFATHYLEEADQVADRIVLLDRGRIVADGTPGELKSAAAHRTVRFTLPEADRDRLRALPGVVGVERRASTIELATRDSDATVAALFAAGLPLRGLEVAGADLESAFLALTRADAPADQDRPTQGAQP
jgi:ABC-2 type transport system ATP-binding protein